MGKDDRFASRGCSPDGVTSTHANPLRDRAVLLHLLREDLLNLESLVGWLRRERVSRKEAV